MSESHADMAQIQAVSLDAAGTLIEVAEPVSEVYARIATKHGGALDTNALAAGFRRHPYWTRSAGSYPLMVIR